MTTKASPSGKHKLKIVNVHLLNGDQYLVHVDVKSKFQEVFNQVAGHLSLRETEYFGLAFKKDDEYHFIVLDEKIHKLAPKQWKSGSGEGTDSQGKALINLWFRVQFYVDQVILLREKVTRHQYYLQLKENVLTYNHLYSEEKCFQLAGYALQADYGNFLVDRHSAGYFDPSFYFPQWMLERHGSDYLAQNMPTIHKDLHNMTRNDAELRYIRNASVQPGAHNLHFYTVRKRKTDKVCNTWLAICAKGVQVHEDDAGYKNHISTFLWKDIGKLYFDKKKFEIRSVQLAGGRRFMYYTDCDVKSKYLLSICRSTHMFQMDIQPKLMEIHHLDNEDQKRYRESYVHSEGGRGQYRASSPGKSGTTTTTQRYSVISDASSNTTSGIVSDRMAVSFDDGDDHQREIMIDCPPRSAMSGTPSQMRTKFQSFGYKSGSSSGKTSPGHIPHSLELCKSEALGGSPQELSPTSSSSNGSWRARHSLGTPRSLTLPSPTTPTQDARPYSALRRSAGRKDSFSKQILQGSLLMTSGDRNNSGDSAVSMSGLFGGSDKLAPLSLPQSELRGLGTGSPGQGMSGCRSSGSSGYSLTPPLTYSHLRKMSGPSPPTSLNFHPGASASTESSPRGMPGLGHRSSLGEAGELQFKSHQNYKALSSPRDMGNDKFASLSSPRANIPEHYPKPLSSPRDAKEVTPRYKASSSPQEPKSYKPLASPRDGPAPSPREVTLGGPLPSPRDVNNVALPMAAWEGSDQLTVPPPQRALHDTSPGSPRADNPYTYPMGGLQAPPPPPPQPQQAVIPPPVAPTQSEFHSANTPSPHSPGMDAYATPGLPSGLPDYHEAIAAMQQDISEKRMVETSSNNNNNNTTAHHHLPAHLQPPQAATLQQQATTAPPYLPTPPHQQQYPPPPQQPKQPAPPAPHHPASKSTVTDHYRLALQQGTSQLSEKSPSSPRGVASTSATPLLDKLASLQYASDLQKQQQQVSKEYHQGNSTSEKDASIPHHQVPMDVEQRAELEENKENLHHSMLDSNPGPEEVGKPQHSAAVPGRPHGKGALHPELKQILGQSHAISLPLITALCNDTSLVQSSRSQSGSRSSYDTSTVRSTDSRLTRFSHDTDPRRWSSCGQGVPEVLHGGGGAHSAVRPYSWHSEHFELDTQLALPVSEHAPPATPANPRAVNNKHLTLLNQASDLLPQKMIESDPGPSSPRAKSVYTAGGGYPGGATISWWDSPPDSLTSDPSSAAWALPYRYPSAHPGRHPSSGSLASQPPRVPHKLTSGGHRDSDSSISHKQMMKENVGIA